MEVGWTGGEWGTPGRANSVCKGSELAGHLRERLEGWGRMQWPGLQLKPRGAGPCFLSSHVPLDGLLACKQCHHFCRPGTWSLSTAGHSNLGPTQKLQEAAVEDTSLPGQQLQYCLKTGVSLGVSNIPSGQGASQAWGRVTNQRLLIATPSRTVPKPGLLYASPGHQDCSSMGSGRLLPEDH